MGNPFKWYEGSRNLRPDAGQARERRAGRCHGDNIENGVIVLTCDRPEAAITLRGFSILVAVFLAFKGAAIAHLGPEIYVAAIQKLQHGALLEQVGAFIMRPDFVSQAIAEQLVPVLR